MKKTILTKEQLDGLIINYVEDLLSSNELAKKFKIGKKRILILLKDNNVNIRSSGRNYLGGKSASDKKHYKKHKEKRLEYHSKWSKENRYYLREYHKKWREENKEHLRETRNRYERNRKASDPMYKLIANFRTAIYTTLKENNVKKNGHYFEVLGYTPTELKEHLEKQFVDGMSWNNYGEWHVDHIKAIYHFNFVSMYDEEFKKCWELSNLQPLWGPDNIKKSNKIIL